ALTVSAAGVNRTYDGTTNATVTLSDNRVAGDVLSTSYTGATFANKNAGTAKIVNVSGITISGTDAANYTANTTTSTTANITTKATRTVIADNKTRTSTASNPTLTASYTNFVGGETLATSGVTGSPALSTTTTTVVGTYPISISAGTLSAGNYDFTFVDGVLTVTAGTATK